MGMGSKNYICSLCTRRQFNFVHPAVVAEFFLAGVANAPGNLQSSQPALH
jgi:hypothetical protein